MKKTVFAVALILAALPFMSCADSSLKISDDGVRLERCDTNAKGTIKIPKGVEMIRNGAFKDCVNVTSVVIPESVYEIGDEAFRGCSSLTSVTFSEGFKGYISYFAFWDCPSLATVNYSGTKAQWVEKVGDVSSSFYDDAPATTVICSDGEVRLRK